ncbi:MAG: hypothetical protein ABII18_11395 [bacterium]|nr:hypothetical protein [bacterium]MBU1918649.1 hypothetical protein [bacterium]
MIKNDPHKNISQNNDWFDEQDLRYFMTLSAREKLEQLESLNKFINQTITQENQEIWEKLQEMGY